MEAALVSAATGALKPVLEKLATLLGDEYKRFRRVRKEIGFMRHELAAMEAFLLKKSMEEDPDVQDKVWMNEVRELSYDIEDSLDDFIVHADDKYSKPRFMNKIKNLLDTTKDRRQIAREIEELKKKIIEASERRKRYTAGEAIPKVKNVTVDRRALAIFENASNLVGIDGPKKEIIKLFNQDTRCESKLQQPKMISIVGFGGLGKTTLAFQVYKELKEQFDCHAFVSVSRNPDMKTVLTNILSQVTGADCSNIQDIPQLISRISNFLAGKRYIIVIDDIWDAEIWNVIKCAFPLTGYDSGIITTTRLNSVAQSCCSSFSGHIHGMDPLSMVHSRQLFHKRIFNSQECPSHLEEVSSQILKKCAGLPLAIIAISGLLASKAKTIDQWHQVESLIGRGLERNVTVEAMMKIISLSYFDLPHHLKTCLLYLSIYPEDYVIGKEMLVRRWIAEGFIRKKNGYTLYEAGEMCFHELINRSLIQPNLEHQKFDEVTGCRVHDTVLDFIVSKSIEDNFVTIIGVPGINPDPLNKVRRLSFQNGGEIPADINLAAVRSLNIFGREVKIPSLLGFNHLRVLCFEHCSYQADLRVLCFEHCYQAEEHHLAGLGNLIHLKCLSLYRGGIDVVQEELEKLRYLETLEMRSLSFQGPAIISRYGRLVHFSGSPYTVPGEIKGLEACEVLGVLDVARHSIKFIRQLGDLTNLRKLILFVSDEAKGGIASSVRKLVQANLRYLFLHLYTSSRNFLEELNLPAKCNLQALWVGGNSDCKVPRWMGSLSNLQKLQIYTKSMSQEEVDILGGIPDLRYIAVFYTGPTADELKTKAAVEIVMAAHPNHPTLVWI